MTEEDYYDITIIGGGPVGMFAATYACMRLAKTQIIESLDSLGGQVSALFPSKKIYDIPGFFGITGAQLITELENQVKQFNPDIFLKETVQNLKKTDLGFEITTSKRTTYSKAIVVAAGVGAFEPRRLKLANAAEFENKNLFYFVKDPKQFANHDIAIAGGGDSAVDWALALEKVAHKVHIIHRRDQFRAMEGSVEQMQQSSIDIHTPYTIETLSQAENDKITLGLKKAKSDDKLELTVDDLIVNYGFVSDNKIISAWNLDMQGKTIKVDQYQQTSIPGIYAIGDIAYREGKINLIATGFGEAPNAVNNALLYVYPEKRQPAHSTQLMKAFEASIK